jgi:hypothetical protein
MGAVAADEDHVPEVLANGQPPLFDFFGLGQPGAGSVNLHQNEEEGQGQGNPIDGVNWEDETIPDQVALNDPVNAALAPQQEVLFDLIMCQC